MTTKRSRLEIYLDVLKAIKKGTRKPTRIMYKTNLSWKPLMKVLESLTAQGFIVMKNENNHIFYEMTEKGKNILRYFSDAMELIEVT